MSLAQQHSHKPEFFKTFTISIPSNQKYDVDDNIFI